MKNEEWSINDMSDLTGRLIIVTGGNSGLGFESTKAFAAKGAEAILAARSIERGKSGTMDFENLMFEKGKYTPMKSYGRSKLANLLFTYELQRRFKSAGLNCVSVAAHPGGANTNLARYLKKKLIFRILMLVGEAFLTQSAAMGALPSIRACLDPNVAGGDYYGPSGFNEMKGYPVRVRSNEASHDKEDAKRLWEVSEKLTKIKYNFE